MSQLSSGYSNMGIRFNIVCLASLVFLFAAFRVDGLCPQAKCKGHGPTVRFPFALKGYQSDDCGYPGYDLSCSTVFKDPVLELPNSAKFLVSKIDYKSQVLHVYDPDGCHPSYLQKIDLSGTPFEFSSSIFLQDYSLFNCTGTDKRLREWNSYYEVRCLRSPSYRIYAFDSNGGMEFSALLSCQKMYNVSSIAYEIARKPKKKIPLSWSKPNFTRCEASDNRCSLKPNSTRLEIECVIVPKKKGLPIGVIAAVVVAGIIAILGLVGLSVFIKSRETKIKNEMKVRKFLEDYRALKPTRFSYADIKRITNEFNVELGQGAYGTVYKGKLSKEVLVAVKVLNTSVTNDGEDFVNEVKIMGTVHHVNVARLVGFCADGFRRALVYEYLPNGSLQNFISSSDEKNILGWDKLQDIALGIARGIDYLHQGCDQRILHFDIKPHNVLLGTNFSPKISDFGMAKLCSKDKSAITMTAARGTVGYIAPEVLSMNFGNVSDKSDIYSFGMLLLEMVGARMVIDESRSDNDQIYFGERIYNLVEQLEDFQAFTQNQEDALISKKLAIVGLWCIQWNPTDRPSMKVIVQMLEGHDDLTVPPNPFASASPMKSRARFPGKSPIHELETTI